MQDFAAAFIEAFNLLARADSDLLEIVGLSLRVSLSAVILSCFIGFPIGAALGIGRFPGRQTLIVCVNALMGLPPVVVGLIVYLFLSNAGPLGWMEILYSPTAMIIAQTILVAPIVAALSRQVVGDLHAEYAEQFRSLPCRRAPPSRRYCGMPGTALPPWRWPDSGEPSRKSARSLSLAAILII